MPFLLALILGHLWIEGGYLPVYAADGSSVSVIDGDSLRIGDVEIRISDYDAPEFTQLCSTEGGWPWPCGQKARLRLKALVAAGGLVCIHHGTDRYSRTLGRCRTTAGDIGSIMVKEGLGFQARRPPSTRYSVEESEAQAAKRGVWQGRHVHPAEYRDVGE